MTKQVHSVAILSGSSSVIGSAIKQQLSAEGVSVTSISRQQSIETNGQSQSLNLDLNTTLDTQSDYQQLTDLSVQSTGEVLWVHSAPIWLLAKHIDTLKSLKIDRVIAFSSTSIDGKSNSQSAKEQATIAKLKQGEDESKRLCLAAGINLTIFRPTMIYGNGQGENIGFIARIIQRFGIFPIIKNASGLRRPVHSSDLASAVCLAANKPASFNKTYNLSGLNSFTYRQMVEQIFASMDRPSRFIVLPKFVYKLGLKTLKVSAKLLGKSLDIDPAMVDRMQLDLDFSHKAASEDFAYNPSEFLPNGNSDLIK